MVFKPILPRVPVGGMAPRVPPAGANSELSGGPALAVTLVGLVNKRCWGPALTVPFLEAWPQWPEAQVCGLKIDRWWTASLSPLSIQ